MCRCLWILLISMSVQACAHTVQTVAPNDLQLTLDMHQSRTDDKYQPVAEVTLHNTTDGEVGVSKTFGFWPYSWLGLFIEDTQGNRVAYPLDMPDLILELPKYRCLKPGETMQWQINLLDWNRQFGGVIWKQGLSFELSPGGYRLQARYTDGPRRGRLKVKVGCPVIDGSVLSDWKSFRVKPD